MADEPVRDLRLKRLDTGEYVVHIPRPGSVAGDVHRFATLAEAQAFIAQLMES